MMDLHVHTKLCDGKSTPEEIVESALRLGVKVLGFSGHSYVEFDPEYSMSPDATKKYFEEIGRLKEKYRDKIKILCGIEQDYFSSMPTDCYDYVIGSVHYFKCGDEYLSVDIDEKTLLLAAERICGGDIYLLAQEYYSMVARLPQKTGCSIIGHFDLIEKFNECGKIFDRNNERYISAYRSAVDKLIEYDIPFEVNTGAMSRGYRTVPYPELEILKYISESGGRVLLSSDSHHADTLCAYFDEAEKIIHTAGFQKKVDKLDFL